MSSLLDSEYLDDRRSFLSPNPPNTIPFNRRSQNCIVSAQDQILNLEDKLTIKQPCRKVDAHVPVPGALSSPFHRTRY